MVSVNSVGDVERILSRLDYRSRLTGDYKINSAEQTLREGKANCLEGSLVAAHLMSQLGYAPFIMSVVTNDIKQNHLIALATMCYHDGRGLKGLTKSKYPEIDKRKNNSKKLVDLARSYAVDLKKHGFQPTEWTVYNLLEVKFDWRKTLKNLAPEFYKLTEQHNYRKF